MSTDSTEQASAPSDGTIVAGPGRGYRTKQYILFIVMLGYGLFSIYDGYIRYPRENDEFILSQRQKAISQHLNPDKVVDPTKVPHGGWDIPFNRAIGLLLPPLSLLLIGRALYNSRGQYRLEGTTLHAPGHPPVPFANITEIDKRSWDRKGIAHISYDLGGGEQGTIRLDDEWYERPPTDEIYKRIDQYMNPQSTEKSAGAEGDSDEEEAQG